VVRSLSCADLVRLAFRSLLSILRPGTVDAEKNAKSAQLALSSQRLTTVPGWVCPLASPLFPGPPCRCRLFLALKRASRFSSWNGSSPGRAPSIALWFRSPPSPRRLSAQSTGPGASARRVVSPHVFAKKRSPASFVARSRRALKNPTCCCCIVWRVFCLRTKAGFSASFAAHCPPHPDFCQLRNASRLGEVCTR